MKAGVQWGCPPLSAVHVVGAAAAAAPGTHGLRITITNFAFSPQEQVDRRRLEGAYIYDVRREGGGGQEMRLSCGQTA